MSAKSGDNLSKVFYTAISMLPIFETYTGEQEEIVQQLEQENQEKQNYYSENINSSSLYNTNGISLESAKAGQVDYSSNSHTNNRDISLKITTSQGEKEFHEFQQRKKCKC